MPNLFIVADGMGGHNAGDYASKHTVEKVVEVVCSYAQEHDPENIMQKAIDEANAFIYQRSREDGKLRGMGTTIVMATCTGNVVTVANIGDSRMYIVNEFITQITQDHSLVAEMVNLGGMDWEAARTHPDKNIITRALGIQEEAQIDLFPFEVEKGNRYLLCSDGLSNMVEDTQLCRLIQKDQALYDIGAELIIEANRNGGTDNIAVVLVEIE